MYSHRLIVKPPADGATWEHAIGRRHPQGRLANEVEMELYHHGDEFVGAVQQARDFFRFIEQTEGMSQKRCASRFMTRPRIDEAASSLSQRA